jgi:hypothetical protein
VGVDGGDEGSEEPAGEADATAAGLVGFGGLAAELDGAAWGALALVAGLGVPASLAACTEAACAKPMAVPKHKGAHFLSMEGLRRISGPNWSNF